MTDYSRDRVRSFAIVANHGAGKTTLAEAMLYICGATEKLGKTDDGSSILDYEAEERSRKMSRNLHVGFCEWGGVLFNFIDTPGFPTFLFETESALSVVDGALLISSGATGIRAQLDKYWQLVLELGLPGILFINKLDKENVDFEATFTEIEKDFETKPILLTLPIGREESFCGFIDLIELKVYNYDSKGKAALSDVPDELAGDANAWREKIVESVAETNDELLEKYLEGETFDKDLLYGVIREGVVNSKFLPVLTGSAAKLIGVDFLLEVSKRYMPTPQDRPPVKGTNLEGEATDIGAGAPQTPCAAVFKTISDPYAGKISIMKVLSGSFASEATVFNSSKRSREKLSHMSRLIGKKQYPVTEALFGDIVAVSKLKDTLTGDTICLESSPVLVPLLKIPQAVISYAIKPKTRADEDKLMISLGKIREEDPTIQFRREEQTGEFLLSGTGQVHVEVTVNKLRDTYGVDVDMKTPKVPYKETICKSTKAEGKYVKQTGGRGQYGDAWLEVEPLKRGGGYEFVNKIVGGAIPKNFIPSVEKGVKEAMQKGVLAGYPVTDVKVTLFDGKYHPVDSSDIAFQIAGSMGFKKAMEDAQPLLLEPIMKMEVTAPEDCLGDVIGDINARRGKVSGVDPQPGGHVISAEAPMGEVLTYAPELRSITSGRGTFSMEFSHYEEVPGHLSPKIIDEVSQ